MNLVFLCRVMADLTSNSNHLTTFVGCLSQVSLETGVSTSFAYCLHSLFLLLRNCSKQPQRAGLILALHRLIDAYPVKQFPKAWGCTYSNEGISRFTHMLALLCLSDVLLDYGMLESLLHILAEYFEGEIDSFMLL